MFTHRTARYHVCTVQIALTSHTHRSSAHRYILYTAIYRDTLVVGRAVITVPLEIIRRPCQAQSLHTGKAFSARSRPLRSRTRSSTNTQYTIELYSYLFYQNWLVARRDSRMSRLTGRTRTRTGTASAWTARLAVRRRACIPAPPSRTWPSRLP